MWEFITRFESVWRKAQSLRRIDSSAIGDIKLTYRTEGVFEPKEKTINNTTIPQHEIEAIAHCISPDIMAFYESEEGQREFAEWQAQQMKSEMQREQMEKQNENNENGVSPPNSDRPAFYLWMLSSRFRIFCICLFVTVSMGSLSSFFCDLNT